MFLTLSLFSFLCAGHGSLFVELRDGAFFTAQGRSGGVARAEDAGPGRHHRSGKGAAPAETVDLWRSIPRALNNDLVYI